MALHQHFAILSLPRTGSTYLVDYLDAAPNVKCLSEVFNPDVVLLRHHQPNDTTLTDKTVRDNDPLRFLYRLDQDVGPCESFGVKLFPTHSQKLLHYFCASRHWKKIFLWRDNILEQYISFLLASAKYGNESWERADDGARLTVPVDTLIDDLHAMEKNYIEIEDALVLAEPEDVFTLEYDDMARKDIMARVLRFIGIGEASVQSVAAAQAGGALAFDRGPRAADRIANYDEVRTILGRTRFARLVA
jgi:LPS sulfotransferase NodH